jgi:tetratricopeptide (TPR) repeat protein
MEKRAPEDAPLTRFTDHEISRRPVRSPAPELPEYTGRVRVFWPPGSDGGIYEKLANRSDWPMLLRRLPPEPEAVLALADALRAAGLYERVLTALPESLGAWRGLALLRFPNRDILRRGLAARPDDPFLLTLYGEALRRDGAIPEAERVLRAAIASDPDQPEAYVNLGVLFAQQNRRDEAVSMFRKALAIEPGNRAAARNLQLAEQGR